jgi:hypothetical protein
MNCNIQGAIGDRRAMTPEEIVNYQVSISAAIGQATFPDHYWLSTANYQPTDPRPLDERFADFKVRLAAAIARRAKKSSFDVGASSVETAGSVHSPPAPALNLLCHSEGVL